MDCFADVFHSQASARIPVSHIFPSVQRDVSALRRYDGPQQGSLVERDCLGGCQAITAYALFVSVHGEQDSLVLPSLIRKDSAISYALSFAALTAVLAHVWIWHRQEIFDCGSASCCSVRIIAKLMAVDHSSSC